MFTLDIAATTLALGFLGFALKYIAEMKKEVKDSFAFQSKIELRIESELKLINYRLDQIELAIPKKTLP